MAESAVGERRRWLTFAMVGAGPTGGAGRADPGGRHQTLPRVHIRPDARVMLFDGGSARSHEARNCPRWPRA
jgi:hypothetical protein